MSLVSVGLIAGAVALACVVALAALTRRTRADAPGEAGGDPTAIARSHATVPLALGSLFGCFAAVVLLIVGIQAHPARLDATTGHLVSCKPDRRGRTWPVLMMKLDASPFVLRLRLHPEDEAGLRDACRSHAHVNVLYRQSRASGKAWVHAVAYVGGREIVSGEVVARRERSEVVWGAAFAGVLAGLAVGAFTISALARRRRERLRSAAAPR